jgi:hypothetical protein
MAKLGIVAFRGLEGRERRYPDPIADDVVEGLRSLVPNFDTNRRKEPLNGAFGSGPERAGGAVTCGL